MKTYLGIFALSFVLLTVSTASEHGVVEIEPNMSEAFVRTGDDFVLSCSVSDEEAATGKPKWQKPTSKGITVEEHSRVEEGIRHSVARLTMKQISQEHMGEYRCSYKASEKSIKLISPIDKAVSAMFKFDDKEAVLTCTIENVATAVSKTEWLRNNTMISDLDDKERFVINEDNHTLTINGPTREDANLYKLRYHFEGLKSVYDCLVPFKAEPYVVKFEKSKNLIEGDSMELQCRVLGYPPPIVHWTKDGTPVNQTSNDHLVLSSIEGFVNARLVIKSVEFEDAGTYTCTANSAYFNQTASKELLVRVKDKLAALWPFLGIVAEVVILCTIIFIYEKRRNKQAESEANNAQDMDGSTADKKEGLRHRNTQSNNPTA